MTRVVLYTARGCSLCDHALEILREAEDDVGLALEVVDVGADEELERRYRERLPVVEIDGEVAFTHFVDPADLRARLGERGRR